MQWIKVGVGACLLSAAVVCQAQSYRVTDHWKIGGEGGWDYLLSDDAAHRLYVTHGARVEVLDTTSGKPVGAITGLNRTHGIALNPDGKTGYISDGGANVIAVFDRGSLQVKHSVAAGANPDGIAFEPVTGTVWAFNGRSKNVSVMDAATNTIVATIALSGKPEFPQVDGTGKVFVNIEDKNEIVELDATRKTVVRSWPLKGCEEPAGLAIDAAAHRLFVGCHNQVMAVVDADNGAVVTSLPIGEGVDANAFDVSTRRVFSAQSDGTLTIFRSEGGDRFSVEQTARTQPGGRTMALNPNTHEVYLVTADFDQSPPAKGQARGRRVIRPGTFRLLVMAPKPL